MDGTDPRLLTGVSPRTIVGGLAVDHKTSLVYWTETKWNGQAILQCDLEGGSHRRLDLAPRKDPSNIAAMGNIIYWQEETHPFYYALYRADVQLETKQLVSNGTELWDLEVLPRLGSFQNSTVDPCKNRTCSYMCVRSGAKESVCLCRDGYVVHKDGYNCTRKSSEPFS